MRTVFLTLIGILAMGNLASFLLVTVITMITVTVQGWRNANENPANSIKTE